MPEPKTLREAAEIFAGRQDVTFDELHQMVASVMRGQAALFDMLEKMAVQQNELVERLLGGVGPRPPAKPAKPQLGVVEGGKGDNPPDVSGT